MAITGLTSISNTAIPTQRRAPGPSRLLPVLLTAIAVGLLAGCAGIPKTKTAEDLRAEARAAFVAQDYARTLSIVEAPAGAGLPWAQYTLGYMYYYGRGVALDRARARQWIQQAANQDYPPAKEALRRLQPPRAAGSDVLADPPSAAAPSPPTPIAGAASAPDPGPLAPPGAVETPASSTPAQAPGTVEAAPVVPPPAALDTPPPPPSTADLAATAPVAPVTEHGLTRSAVVPLPAAPSAPTPATAVAPPTVPPTTTDQPSSATVGEDDEARANTWIENQDPHRLTLQLIGSTDREAVLRYIREHGIAQDAAYYVTSRDGQAWYVVIYGNYADHNAAQAALLRLPPALRAASPWIRRFGDIQPHLFSTP